MNAMHEAVQEAESEVRKLKEKNKKLRAENKWLKEDISFRQDYESYLQSTSHPVYSYTGWKEWKHKKGGE